MQEFTQKDLTPADRIGAKALDKTVQEDMALPIVSEMATVAYAEAARSLGDENMALAISSGVMFEGGVIDERLLVEAILQKQNPVFNITEYVAKVREVVPEVARRVTTVDGSLEAQTAVAAINKLLFDNNITAYANNLVADRLEASLATQKRENVKLQRETQVFLPGGAIEQRGL